MKNENVMRCPHCRELGTGLWNGYGDQTVVCECCQRRIRWEEVETAWLLDDDDLWNPVGAQPVGAFH